MSKGWIGVDLDGTLAFYDVWRGPQHIGEPVPKMVERLKRWIWEDEEVRIMTARVHPQSVAAGGSGSQIEVVQSIWDWLRKHRLPQLPVTCEKDFNMKDLWDDRVTQVIMNTGLRADGRE